jgi:hypothetical protein
VTEPSAESVAAARARGPRSSQARYADLETGLRFAGLPELLAEFGAVAGDGITRLGH